MSLFLRNRALIDQTAGGVEYDPSADYDIWLDPNDISGANMWQEVSGTSGTAVTVGDPIGAMVNKGTLGGIAYASETGRRPVLAQNATTGAYYMNFTLDRFRLASVSIPATGDVAWVLGINEPSLSDDWRRFSTIHAAAGNDTSTNGFNITSGADASGTLVYLGKLPSTGLSYSTTSGDLLNAVVDVEAVSTTVNLRTGGTIRDTDTKYTSITSGTDTFDLGASWSGAAWGTGTLMHLYGAAFKVGTRTTQQRTDIQALLEARMDL